MRDGDALRYLLDRQREAGREIPALAILVLLPALGFGVFRPDWLATDLLVTLVGAFVLLPLSIGGRLGALALAWRRGGGLEEMRSVGLEAPDLLAALVGRALARGLGAGAAVAAGALVGTALLPSGERGFFLTLALALPVGCALLAATVAGLFLLGALRVPEPGSRAPRSRKSEAGPFENPLRYREALRGQGRLGRGLAWFLGLASLVLGVAVSDEVAAGPWLGLGGLWAVLFAGAAWRASTTLAREREGRTLEALLATRTSLDELVAAWRDLALQPLRGLVGVGVAAPWLALWLDPDWFFPGDAGDWMGRGTFPHLALPAALPLAFGAAALGLLIPRAGAWLGLWSAALAPNRSRAVARLAGGLGASAGGVLLTWAGLVFPTGIASEHLWHNAWQELWQAAALVLFPMLAVGLVSLVLTRIGRDSLPGLVVQGAVREHDRHVPAGPLAAALQTLWHPGHLLVVPAALTSLVFIWSASHTRPDRLDELVFFALLMSGLGLFSSTATWLVLGRPLTRAWERLERAGTPLLGAVTYGVALGTLASLGVLGTVELLDASLRDSTGALALGPVLGAALALRAWLASRR